MLAFSFVNFKIILILVCINKGVHIEWGLEYPEQPIRYAGKFEIWRNIERVNSHLSETTRKREKKGRFRRKSKVSTLDI